jgi:hypothetical protein
MAAPALLEVLQTLATAIDPAARAAAEDALRTAPCDTLAEQLALAACCATGAADEGVSSGSVERAFHPLSASGPLVEFSCAPPGHMGHVRPPNRFSSLQHCFSGSS